MLDGNAKTCINSKNAHKKLMRSIESGNYFVMSLCIKYDGSTFTEYISWFTSEKNTWLCLNRSFDYWANQQTNLITHSNVILISLLSKRFGIITITVSHNCIPKHQSSNNIPAFVIAFCLVQVIYYVGNFQQL